LFVLIHGIHSVSWRWMSATYVADLASIGASAASGAFQKEVGENGRGSAAGAVVVLGAVAVVVAVEVVVAVVVVGVARATAVLDLLPATAVAGRRRATAHTAIAMRTG
jgi:hypothetical protein